MIIYILLSLSLVFGSKESADKIYHCTFKMAKSEAHRSNDYTVREAVEACRDTVGSSNIKIEEAKITMGTTHKFHELLHANHRFSMF